MKPWIENLHVDVLITVAIMGWRGGLVNSKHVATHLRAPYWQVKETVAYCVKHGWLASKRGSSGGVRCTGFGPATDTKLREAHGQGE